MIHRIVAISLIFIFLLIFTGKFEYYSGFNTSQAAVSEFDSEVSEDAAGGILYVYLIAAFSCYCLLFPNSVSEKLSPRTGNMQTLLLKDDFWLIVGYFSVAVTFLVLEAFR
ncbi:MAG: hypothetical protein HRT55_01775 [Colwellia sp.]|uniref:hypothetical protein n=1 Tax=Colwellia sp. TaxID=56799 RepID=UPI0025C594EC|nr:hypothetical protein [Colwellia sp.]NQZ25028.1 hypothetical protein [Colwellia sp.]